MQMAVLGSLVIRLQWSRLPWIYRGCGPHWEAWW